MSAGNGAGPAIRPTSAVRAVVVEGTDGIQTDLSDRWPLTDEKNRSITQLEAVEILSAPGGWIDAPSATRFSSEDEESGEPWRASEPEPYYRSTTRLFARGVARITIVWEQLAEATE